MTKEEVLKKFEELGYEIYQEEKYIAMKNKAKKEITIKFIGKHYFKRDDDNFWEIITFQEHQLLTELFKALGWFDEKKIKDLTLEERKTICDKYYIGYKPKYYNCLKCPLCVGIEDDFGRAICGNEIIDFVNKEIEVEKDE